jgi:thiamine-phosphate diphosphorylase
VIRPLHLVTDDAILARSDFTDLARGAMHVGGKKVALHIRGPGLEGRTIFELAQALRDDAAKAGALLLVNDRLDVVLALDLPGGHLGQRSLSPGHARGIVGPHRILGLSVHDRIEAEESREGQLDFLMVGTLFSTPSHPGVVPGGVERLDEIASTTALPLIGIGGIRPNRVGEVMEAGAYGVAVRGGVWEAPNPVGAVESYLQQLESHSAWDSPGEGTPSDSSIGLKQ